MPRRNEYTFVVVQPLSPSRAAIMTEQLVKSILKQEGITAEITCQKRRPGDAPSLIQPVEGFPVMIDAQAAG